MDFFKKTGEKDAWIRIVQRTSLNKFKALANFLKDSSGSTNSRNIELLAWLISFEPRPLEQAQRLRLTAAANLKPQSSKPEIDVTIGIQHAIPYTPENKKPEPMVSVQAKETKRGKKTIVVISVLVAFGMVLYLSRIGRPSNPAITGHETCMYWSEDHYQPVSCSQKIENVQVIALDSEKVVHFRKITRPDTITDNAVGHVWYVRYRGNYEYYTADGFHPLDPQLRLRPLTEYIIFHHLRVNQ